MKNRRGPAAGFPAPRPGPGNPWVCEGSEFSLHDIAFNADDTFNGPEGLVFNWQDEFYGTLGDIVLSKEAGPDGHCQLPDRSVVWINRDADYWYTVTVQALPAPLMKLEPPPPELEDRSLIFSYFAGSDMQHIPSWFVPLPGGAFECNGVCFDAESEINFTNPMMGETIRRKAGSGVICIDSQMTRNVIVFAKPGLKRLLGHPSGWFQIKLGHHVTSMNSMYERFLWSCLPKLFLLLFTLAFWPIVFFTGPVIFFLHYHSGKLHLPSSFINNQEVLDYYSEYRTTTVVEATHITLADLMNIYGGKSSS